MSSDSAPEASGRPMIAPRATSCRARQDNNVVPMPGTVIDQAPLAPTADVAPPTDRWKGLAEPGTPLALGPRRHRRAGFLVRSAAFPQRRTQRL